MVPRSLAAISIGTRCGFGCGIGLGLWFFTGFGRHPHHGCRQHWCRLRMNAHRTYRPGGRLWAGHGPRSVQPHVLSSLRSLPGYPASITQELVTLLPRLPTQATAKARAAAPLGCGHQERRLSPFIPTPGRRSETVTRGSAPSQAPGRDRRMFLRVLLALLRQGGRV